MTRFLKLAFAVGILLSQHVFGENAGPLDLNAAFKSLAETPAATLTIPPGTYRLPKGGLVLSGVKDTVIEARGVTLLATDTASAAIRMMNCANVTWRGAAIDYDPLPFTQGSITAVDAKTRTAEVEIHAGYPDLNKVYTAKRLVHVFEKDAPRWKPGTPDYYAKAIDILTPRTARITFTAESRPEKVKVGDRVVFNIRKIAGIEIKNCGAGITFEDVTVYTAPAIGFLIRFCEEAGTYRNVRIIPGPKPAGATQERLFSTCADGFNAAYTRKGPTIEGCEFSYMGDDGVNLHGVTLPVLKWIDDRTFLSMRPQKSDAFDKLIRPGDEIRFLREPNYEVVAVGRVESASAADEKRETWSDAAHKIWPTFRDSTSAAFYRIRLTESMSGVVAGDLCDIPATSASNFVIRNSYFHDHRARGLRLMSNDGVVEKNRFERLKGAAITMGPEYVHWREAGWTRNITVRDNEIRNVGEGDNIALKSSYTPAAICVMARVVPLGAQTSYVTGNEKITISGNLIEGCSVGGICIVAAKDVKVSGNTIRRINLANATSAASEYGLPSPLAISVFQAQADLSDNHVEPAVSSSKISQNP